MGRRRRRQPGGSCVLDGAADVAVGHRSQGGLVQSPAAASEALQVVNPGADSSGQAFAVGSELKAAVDLDSEESQRVPRRHRLPCHPYGASDGVSGVLGQHQQLGLLRGDDHLVVACPGSQGVSRCLSALSCHLHRVAGAQDRSVIRVYVRGGARCSEGLS